MPQKGAERLALPKLLTECMKLKDDSETISLFIQLQAEATEFFIFCCFIYSYKNKLFKFNTGGLYKRGFSWVWEDQLLFFALKC